MSIRPAIGAIILLLSSTLASAVKAEEDKAPFCPALYALVAEAQTRADPVRITVDKQEAFTVFCGWDKMDATQGRFCDAVIQHIGLEFTHQYPWRVKSCIEAQGARPVVELRDEYTGLIEPHAWGRTGPRKKLVHLAARLSQGVNLDLRYKPSDNDYFEHWFGTYELVLWKAP